MLPTETTQQCALQKHKQEDHTSGSNAASRFHDIQYFEIPVRGWWQTPVQDGFWPRAAKAVDSLAAGLLRLGFPSDYVRKKLQMKVESQLQEKEAEIAAAKELLQDLGAFSRFVTKDCSGLVTEERKARLGWFEAEEQTGVPITPELCNFLLDQQRQFVERLIEERSGLENTLQSCEGCAPGSLFSLFSAQPVAKED